MLYTVHFFEGIDSMWVCRRIFLKTLFISEEQKLNKSADDLLSYSSYCGGRSSYLYKMWFMYKSSVYPQCKVVCNEKWPSVTTLKRTKSLAITNVTFDAEIKPYFFLLID